MARNRATSGNEPRQILWFEQSLQPEQKAQVEQVLKELKLDKTTKIIHGVKRPDIVDCDS